MIVPVRYTYFIWTPPKLTRDQEIEFGREIAKLGKQHFVDEFRRNLGKTSTQTARPVNAFKKFLAGAFLIGMLVIVFLIGMGPPLIIIATPVLALYFVSRHFAIRSYDRWLDALVAKAARSSESK